MDSTGISIGKSIKCPSDIHLRPAHTAVPGREVASVGTDSADYPVIFKLIVKKTFMRPLPGLFRSITPEYPAADIFLPVFISRLCSRRSGCPGRDSGGGKKGRTAIKELSSCYFIHYLLPLQSDS